MRLTKIYTKTGDGGKTRLATGEQISKSAHRLEAYGTVDELNAVVGVVRDSLKLYLPEQTEKFDSILVSMQNRLFDLGGELAMPGQFEKMSRTVNEDDVMQLEQSIDFWNKDLPPLKNFVLPGGHLVNSYLHLARTICRRCERQVVRMNEMGDDVRPQVIKYLNRLSDLLFVASRQIIVEAGVEEVLWEQENTH